jgi:tetratricopeptide (TPR) repeat protein
MPCSFVSLSAAGGLFLLLASPAWSQNKERPATVPVPSPSVAAPPVAAPAVAVDYSKEGLVYDKISTVLRYEADGTGEKTITAVLSVQSESAVHEAGLLTFDYASGNENLEVVYVRVRKPGGAVAETPATDRQDMPTEVTRAAPFYSDTRQMQIPVKSLSVGDKLEYQVKWVRQKATVPGEFWGAENFMTANVVLAETIEIGYPSSKYAMVVSPNFTPSIKEENARKIYRWTSSQLKPTSSTEKAAPPDADRLPSIYWTTYKDWEEIGDWFRSLASERAAVTPAIQAKATQLIAGKTTDDEKIEAIYNYVSTQVRYIGVAFGIGRYQPHSADAVLDNQYGDCKDKHTLLASLLKAAGYDAWPVLIGSSIKLHPEFPSPAQFDHVITLVNLHDRQIWLDSTPEITPYRLLFATLRDKQALVIPTAGKPQLMRTPADGPFPFVDTYTATAKLDDQGTLKGHIDFEMRGDSEAIFRSIFHASARNVWQQMAQSMSQSLGFAGNVSNLDVSLPERTTEPFHYAYDYDRKEYADWSNRRILPLMFPITIPSVDEDTPPVKPIELGSPHVESHHSEIELPAAYTATLPHSVKYTAPFATYEATYKLDGQKFITDRTLKVLQRAVAVEQAGELKKFGKNVSNDEDQYIQLTVVHQSATPGDANKPAAAKTPEVGMKIEGKEINVMNLPLIVKSPGVGGAPGTTPEASAEPRAVAAVPDGAVVEPAQDDPKAQELIDSAEKKLERRDLAGARADLHQAEQLSPHQRNLWAQYAYIDSQDNQLDRSLTELRNEIKYHPDNIWAYRAMASTQVRLRKNSDAEQTMRDLLKVAPNDSAAEVGLGELLLQDKKYDESSTLLETASKQASDNIKLSVDAGRAQLLAGKVDAGTTTLRAALSTSTDPWASNNAAFALADANLELPLAESSCRKALDTVEKDTSQVNLGNLTRDDLGQMQLMTATWDTMGWIYFREGKLPLAETYVSASWKASQRKEVGDHLRQIYEKEGRKSEAAGIASENLQGARTLTIPDTWKGGSADFYMLLAPDGVAEVQFVSGDERLRSALPILKKARFSRQVPTGSPARLLRRGILFCSKETHVCEFTLIPPEAVTLN